MRWKRTLVGVLLAAAIFWLLLRRADPQQVWAGLRLADWPLLLLVQAFGCGSIFLKGQRWSWAIGAGGEERPRRHLFSATVIGTAANMILPARLGDLLRAWVMRKHNAIPATRALLASWSAQAFDVLAVAVLLLVAAFAGQGLASQRVLWLLLVGIVCGAAGAGLLARRPELLTRWAARLPRAWRGPAGEFIAHAAGGLRFLGEPAVVLRVSLFTAAIWSLEVCGMWLALRAFHIAVGLPAAALVVAAVGLSFALPLTPGNVGTYQLIAVLVLGRFGVDNEHGVAFSLGFQAFSLVATVALGYVFFQREQLSLADLRAAGGTSPQAP